MIDVAYCKHFARYSRWQNRSIYAAAAKLPDDIRKRNMGAFFKSIHATLNHLMVADRLWLDRFEGLPTVGISSLDQELYSNFEELTKQRENFDDRLDRFVSSLTPDRIASEISYRRLSGDKGEVTSRLEHCLIHYFNHGTHHRGQVTTLLMQCGVDPGVTDLMWLPKDFASPMFGV
jgi:uncharacterized damage-inducible protein DinB